MSNSSNKNPIQRIIIIGSGLVFLGLMLIPLVQSLAPKSPKNAPSNPAQANPEAQKQLLAMAQGYEQVLKREPNNVTALQGLAQANIQLGNLYGALPPLEKLYQINPKDPQVMLFLAEARVQTGDKDGGVALLEDFVKQYPDIPVAKERLAQLKQPTPATPKK
jgi:cytochrome c-type biogenesis protein CcmH/NrfG